MSVSDEAVDAAWAVLREHFDLGGYAKVSDYLTPGSEGAEREAEIAALKTADHAAYERTRAVIREALDAALQHRRAG